MQVTQVDKVIEGMLNNDVIEEHPMSEPAPWILNVVFLPKPDGSLRMILDAQNLNKAIKSSNLPIPRQEDITGKIKKHTNMLQDGIRINLVVARTPSRFTVHNHCYTNSKSHQYKRLTMGVTLVQGKLNIALRPLFATSYMST